MNNWLKRTKKVLGEKNVNKLKNKHIIVFGIGGVGSFAVEGLIRAGIGSITIIDKDIVDVTNINRQIHATTHTIDNAKVQVMKERILQINPSVNIEAKKVFADKTNIPDLIGHKAHYVVDAIDNVTSKIELILYCNNNNIPIISSMGTGNKIDPTRLQVTDIYKTDMDPLAKVMRRELRKRNIKSLKVVFSDEKPVMVKNFDDDENRIPGSVSWVPSCAGLIISGEVVKDIIKEKE